MVRKKQMKKDEQINRYLQKNNNKNEKNKKTPNFR